MKFLDQMLVSHCKKKHPDFFKTRLLEEHYSNIREEIAQETENLTFAWTATIALDTESEKNYIRGIKFLHAVPDFDQFVYKYIDNVILSIEKHYKEYQIPIDNPYYLLEDINKFLTQNLPGVFGLKIDFETNWIYTTVQKNH